MLNQIPPHDLGARGTGNCANDIEKEEADSYKIMLVGVLIILLIFKYFYMVRVFHKTMSWLEVKFQGGCGGVSV